MSKTIGLLIVLASVIFISACNGKARVQPSTVGDVNNVQINLKRSAAVEAYLVYVDMDALYDAGVKQIPTKKGEQVTAEKLLDCISDPNHGSILRADRMVIKEGKEGVNQNSNKKYFNRIEKFNMPGVDKQQQSIAFEEYDNDCSIRVHIQQIREKHISFGIAYSYSGYDQEPSEEDETKPARTAYTFKCELGVAADEPVVIGGMQDGSKGLFLVVRTIPLN
jgi:hypothetical protein